MDPPGEPRVHVTAHDAGTFPRLPDRPPDAPIPDGPWPELRALTYPALAPHEVPAFFTALGPAGAAALACNAHTISGRALMPLPLLALMAEQVARACAVHCATADPLYAFFTALAELQGNPRMWTPAWWHARRTGTHPETPHRHALVCAAYWAYAARNDALADAITSTLRTLAPAAVPSLERFRAITGSASDPAAMHIGAASEIAICARARARAPLPLGTDTAFYDACVPPKALARHPPPTA